MASPLPPMPGAGDPGTNLGGPPPNPVNSAPQLPSTDATGAIPGTPVSAPGQDDSAKFLASVGLELDQALMALAKAIPESGSEFSQARQLIQSGIAKHLSAGPGAVAASPEATGSTFTGVGGA